MEGVVMKELTILSRNEVGTLAAIAEALGGVGVNIEAISAYEENNKAVFRLVTNDVTTAKKTLSKIPDLRINESDIIVLKMQNRPGELGKITRKLANRGVNIESIYIVTKAHDYTEVALKPGTTEDFVKARDVLGLK